jgi:hypothetical protein
MISAAVTTTGAQRSESLRDDRLVIVEMITLGNSDLSGEDDDEAGSDLADDPKRFTGCKGANFPNRRTRSISTRSSLGNI